MSNSQTALLVIDAQESFRHRPYWSDRDVPLFLNRLQTLIDGAKSRYVPVVQIFHVEESGPFSIASGYVKTIKGLSITPDAVFQKRSHSALVGSGLDVWLVQHGIRRLIISGIRTEQCCETTTRHSSDIGYEVDYVTEATLTFAMTDRRGKQWSSEEIKARTELVLDERFARIVSVEEALSLAERQGWPAERPPFSANSPEGGHMRRIQVYVVLPPRLTLLDIAGPVEVLRRANREQIKVRFDVRYIGASPSVLTSIGIPLTSIEPLPAKLPDGAMIIVAGDVDEVMRASGQTYSDTLEKDKSQMAAIVKWLKTAVRPGHKLIAICSGALMVGEAGLLDGYTCTTHHLCCEELATIAPKATVLENRLYVEDRERYSSAGITAGIDLMLHIVEQPTDEACTAGIARYLVVYLRRSGADPQLSPWLEGRNHIHPAVHRVQDAISHNPAKDWNLNGLARIAGASNRHLSRLFHEHAGMSITDYRNRLRTTLARELISQTQLDIEQVAERAGFGSTRQLRRAWRRLYGTTPRQARAR